MRGRDLVGSTRAVDRPALPVRSRASGGCCCRGSRADTSGRTSILGLFPCWAATASRSCSGLGMRGHSADGGFILRRVAWLSQAKTRPEECPACIYSGTVQTGGCTFHAIAPAWGVAATCDIYGMAGARSSPSFGRSRRRRPLFARCTRPSSPGPYVQGDERRRGPRDELYYT